MHVEMRLLLIVVALKLGLGDLRREGGDGQAVLGT